MATPHVLPHVFIHKLSARDNVSNLGLALYGANWAIAKVGVNFIGSWVIQLKIRCCL